MGGRGGTSGMAGARAQRSGTRISSGRAQNASTISQQAPSANNTPLNPNALSNLQNMDDAQLAALVNSAKGVDMPNMLNDVRDRTQEFVYTIGLNEKPEVLDDADFDKYLKDNNIPNSQILSRSVKPVTYKNASQTTIHMTEDDISDMLKDSAFNYIGGKQGGQLSGGGTYFAMNGGYNTGYGNQTITGVLSKNAKVIDRSTLRSQIGSYQRSHPQAAQAIGNLSSGTMSIYALAMGYNVIHDENQDYYNVIDRSAVVLRKKDR